jgi:hypothetical protein
MINDIGINKFQEIINAKMKMLNILLKQFNDGSRKQF